MGKSGLGAWLLLQCAGDGGDDVGHGADEDTFAQSPGVGSIEDKDKREVREYADLQELTERRRECPAESLKGVP